MTPSEYEAFERRLARANRRANRAGVVLAMVFLLVGLAVLLGVLGVLPDMFHKLHYR